MRDPTPDGPRPEAPALVPATIGPQSRVAFHDLTVHREPGRDPLLGCPRSRAFLEVDEDTLVAIDAIRATRTLDEAEAKLAKERGETYDLVALVTTLTARGFVRSIDDLERGVPQEARAKHPWLHAIPTASLRWLHHPLLLIAIGALVTGWLALLIMEPAHRPSSSHLAITPSPAGNILLAFAGFLAFAYIHELAHFFTARSFGIDSTIAVSHRFYILVLQTDVTNAWLLPARQKLAIFLAGIGFNLTAASLGTLVLAASADGFLAIAPTTEAWIRFAILLNLFPLVFQLFVFARTDLYHVILVVTRQRNLAGDSMAYLKFLALRAWRIVRGAPALACVACGQRTLREDPFCLRCGTKLDVDDPNRYPFVFKDRLLLPIVGGLFVLGTAVAYTFVFLLLTRVAPRLVDSARALADAIQARDLAMTAEALVAGTLLALQLAFVAYFVGQALKARLPAGLLDRVRARIRGRAEGDRPVVDHVRLAEFHVVAERGALRGAETRGIGHGGH